jgi:DNA-binding SARP family transcriptional activator
MRAKVQDQAVDDGISVRLFGPISITVRGSKLGPRDFGGVKPKQILELLLVARGKPLSKDRLADVLWGESLPRNVSGTLETYVSVLRRRLEPNKGRGSSVLVTEPGAYRLNLDRADVDLDEFDEMVTRARHTEDGAARRLLEQALMLVRGEVLEDEPYAEWADLLRNEYRQAVTQALLDAAELALVELDHHAALAHAQQAINTDPLNERAYRTLMLASYVLGRQREALGAYRDCRSLLIEELGVEPLERTRELHHSILNQVDPEELLPRGTPDGNGVASSYPKEGDLFLGRSRDLKTIVHTVERSLSEGFSLTLIEGVAGSGKSRLLDEVARHLPLVTVSRTSCNELEQEIPYATIAGVLDLNLVHFYREEDHAVEGNEVIDLLHPKEQATVLDRLIDNAAYHAPFVVLIDDLQWADPASITALSYLQRRCMELPVAVVATVRTDSLDDSNRIKSLRTDLRARIEPLDQDELEELGLEWLFERTGGHLGYVAEYLTSEGDELPKAVRDSILARSSAQGPLRHKLLLNASVIEAPFYPKQLAALVGCDEEPAAEELEALCRNQLLRPVEGGFDFFGMDVRDALVESLSQPRRNILLRRASTILDSSVLRFDRTIEDSNSSRQMSLVRDA